MAGVYHVSHIIFEAWPGITSGSGMDCRIRSRMARCESVKDLFFFVHGGGATGRGRLWKNHTGFGYRQERHPAVRGNQVWHVGS